MNLGIFGCDPGGSTGLAWGIFNPHEREIRKALLEKMHAGSSTVDGGIAHQVREVSSIWRSFYHACVKDARLPPEHIYFVCEDYVLRPGHTPGGLEATVSPSIIYGIQGYRDGRRDEWLEAHPDGKYKQPQMFLQTAGEATSFCSNEKLKAWGLWTVGREHERSAWRHVALFLKRYQMQRM